MEGRILSDVILGLDDNIFRFAIVNHEDMERDEFVELMTDTIIEWDPYPKDPSTVVFLYPVGKRHEDQGFFKENVQSKKYPISSLTDGLEVLNIILRFYSKNLAKEQIDDLFDNSDDEMYLGCITLKPKHPRHSFLGDSPLFNGIEQLSSGVYYVHVISEYSKRHEDYNLREIPFYRYRITIPQGATVEVSEDRSNSSISVVIPSPRHTHRTIPYVVNIPTNLPNEERLPERPVALNNANQA